MQHLNIKKLNKNNRKNNKCMHPPNRLYCLSGRDAQGMFISIVCCDCGKVLHNS